MATDGFNWTQLSMSRANNFPSGTIKYLDAATIKERGAMHAWHTTFARSIPALVSGLGDDVAASFSGWRREDYRRHWGEKDVVVAFSPDEMFQRGVLRSGLRRLQARRLVLHRTGGLRRRPRPDEAAGEGRAS